MVLADTFEEFTSGKAVYSYFSSYVDVPHSWSPWKASLNFLSSSEYVIRDGYAKYATTGGMFKIRTFPRYLVFVTDMKHVEELRCSRKRRER
ncbi:hypothetical protein RUND412_008183 [Rhizina undulata]